MRAASRVLDAYSLIAYLEGENGAEKMIEVIRTARDSGRDLMLSVVNWGEVFYITLREMGAKRAEEVAHIISTLPIRLIDADLELIRQAAVYKAAKKMSYADCIAAALAKLRKAELVTGDRDFKQLENEIKIMWID
jgi:predicted nucleic acid-binding protein